MMMLQKKEMVDLEVPQDKNREEEQPGFDTRMALPYLF